MTAQRSSRRPWACTTRFDAPLGESCPRSHGRAKAGPAQGRSLKLQGRRRTAAVKWRKTCLAGSPPAVTGNGRPGGRGDRADAGHRPSRNGATDAFTRAPAERTAVMLLRFAGAALAEPG